MLSQKTNWLWLVLLVTVVGLVACSSDEEKTIAELKAMCEQAETHQDWLDICRHDAFRFSPGRITNQFEDKVLQGLASTADSRDQMFGVIDVSYYEENWNHIGPVVQGLVDSSTNTQSLWDVLIVLKMRYGFTERDKHCAIIAAAMFDKAKDYGDWYLVIEYAYGWLNSKQQAAVNDSMLANCHNFSDYWYYSQWRHASQDGRQLAHQKLFELAGDDHRAWRNMLDDFRISAKDKVMIFDRLVYTTRPKHGPKHIAIWYHDERTTAEHRQYLLGIYDPSGLDVAELVNILNTYPVESEIWSKTYQSLLLGKDIVSMVDVYEYNSGSWRAPSSLVRAKLLADIVNTCQTVEDWALVAESSAKGSSLHTLALQNITCQLQN